MDKAFDVLFQSEVDAMAVARTSSHTYGERFRYQCICCGEEVYLAAADSAIKSPHFVIEEEIMRQIVNAILDSRANWSIIFQ